MAPAAPAAVRGRLQPHPSTQAPTHLVQKLQVCIVNFVKIKKKLPVGKGGKF